MKNFLIKQSVKNYPTIDSLEYLEDFIVDTEDSGDKTITTPTYVALDLYNTTLDEIAEKYNYYARDYCQEFYPNYSYESDDGTIYLEYKDYLYSKYKEEIDYLVQEKLEEIYQNVYSFINTLQVPLTIYRRMYMHVYDVNNLYKSDFIEDYIREVFQDNMGIYWSANIEEQQDSYSRYHSKEPDTQENKEDNKYEIMFLLTAVVEDENDIDWRATAAIHTLEPTLEEVRLFPNRIIFLKHLTIETRPEYIDKVDAITVLDTAAHFRIKT